MRLIDTMPKMGFYLPSSKNESVMQQIPDVCDSPFDEGRLERARQLIKKIANFVKPQGDGYGEELRGLVQDSGVSIIADEVAEFVLSYPDSKELEYSDIPNATPPFPRFWIEANHKSFEGGLYVRGRDLWAVDKLKVAVGAISAPDPFERWRVDVRTFIRIGENHTFQIVQSPDIFYTVSPEGRIVRPPASTDKGSRELDALESFWTYVLLTAISFVHCRNVTLSDIRRDVKTDAERKGIGKLPLIQHKTLNIGQVKSVVHGVASGEGIRKALHVCRGHFKHYGKENPLFGRIVGTVWCPQHARGAAERGTVTKDYKIKAPSGELNASA